MKLLIASDIHGDLDSIKNSLSQLYLIYISFVIGKTFLVITENS